MKILQSASQFLPRTSFILHYHRLPHSLPPLAPLLQPRISLDEGESPRATLRRASLGEERPYPLSPLPRFTPIQHYVTSVVSVVNASKLRSTMIDKVINHRIGKSSAPTSGGGRVRRPHAYFAHLGDRECPPLEMRASVSFPINASVRRRVRSRGREDLPEEMLGFRLREAVESHREINSFNCPRYTSH